MKKKQVGVENMRLFVVKLKRFLVMRTVALLVNLLIVLNTARMTAVNSALNVMTALGKMKRQWHNVRPIWYSWNLQKRRKYEFLRK
ncbi:hypothetical protein EBT23_05915 [bacterium]|nr:hypothetical protein [bacterium]